jgi:cyclase
MRSTILALGLVASGLVGAQSNSMDAVKVSIEPIRGGLHLVQGSGGNIVASVGADGVFIVDDQFAPLGKKISAAIAKVSKKPIRFVINTHWHGDHTGGNEYFGKSGAVIVAHDNVYKRMSTDQFMASFNETVPAAPHVALPVVTFSDAVTLHLNGTVRVLHVAHAHTDGDALVHFADANVLHMGDTYFNGLYPFIDVGSQGGIDGVLAALDKGLSLANADTIIVPGHGPLSSRASMQSYRDMLKGFRDQIAALKAAGKSLEEIKAAKPTAEFDAQWGGKFISADFLVESIYASL